MRKSLAIGLALVLAAGTAWARPAGMIPLMTLLSGEPAPVGTLVSATGASITNATTAAPFTFAAVGARVISVQCDAVAFIGFGGTTCGITLATSAGCVRIGAADVPLFVILQDNTTAMNVAGPAALNCIVNKYF